TLSGEVIMHLKFRNVNDAFVGLVQGIHKKEIPTVAMSSRYGDVLRIPEPVIITYRKPRERVLFNQKRDCNPFFHLYESLWMLAGRNDVASLAYYNKRMPEFSDNGKTFHGAYGYRWRNHFGWDQLRAIVEELRTNSNSRRVVLQMWDANISNLRDDDWFHDFYMATHGGK